MPQTKIQIALEQLKDFDNLDQRNVVKKRATICSRCYRCKHISSKTKLVSCYDEKISLIEDYCPLSNWNEVNKKHEEILAKRNKSNKSICRAGSELKKLLSFIGIKSGPSCNCGGRANTMDQMGCDWCEKNKERIVEWLEEEAKKRNIPFSKLIASKIVDIAIKRAKKKC